MSVERRYARPILSALHAAFSLGALGGALLSAGVVALGVDVQAHLVAGASEKEVAALIGRSRHTVHSYVKRIYRTLGIRSRSQLASSASDRKNRTIAARPAPGAARAARRSSSAVSR